MKQQLSEALESRTHSPVSSLSQRFSELKGLQAKQQADKEIAATKDRNEELLHVQVCSLSTNIIKKELET